MSLYASTYLIVSIAIDRLLCVLKPIGVIRKRRRYKMCMIAVPWILSISINIPTLYWTTIFSQCGCHICTPDLRGIREVSLYINIHETERFSLMEEMTWQLYHNELDHLHILELIWKLYVFPRFCSSFAHSWSNLKIIRLFQFLFCISFAHSRPNSKISPFSPLL